MRSRLTPVTLTEARRFVNLHHRHNEAPPRYLFATGLELDGELVGVAIVGRPTARKLAQADPFLVEITRVATACEEKNANSKLYGAACRMAKAGGYRSVITYTLPEESGASLRAAGFVVDAELPPPPSWSSPTRLRQTETLFGPRRRPTGPKIRWRRELYAIDEVAA